MTIKKIKKKGNFEQFLFFTIHVALRRTLIKHGKHKFHYMKHMIRDTKFIGHGI